MHSTLLLLLAGHSAAFSLVPPLAPGPRYCAQPRAAGPGACVPRAPSRTSLRMASAGRGGLGEGSSEPDAASISAEQAARLRAESVSLAGRQTYIEQAAAADLDQAELELKLESLKGELQAINKKMIATLRRRRKLLKQKDGAMMTPQQYVDQRLRSAVLSAEADFVQAEENSFVGSIDTFCTAEEYDMDMAFRRLRVWSRGNAKFLESASVVHVRTGSRYEEDEDDPMALKLVEADEGDVFVFPYGVVVCWGLTGEQTQELLTVMRFCERRGYVEPEVDSFEYFYGEEFDYVAAEDRVVLTTRPSDGHEALEQSVREKLAASYGFAQSARLEPFAESVQKSIEDTRGLAAELAATGAIVSQSQKDIARTLGRLILDRHSIYLYSDVLDTPDVCWENPDLVPLYRLVSKQLELAPRVELLNARVEIVRELLVVLSDELQNKHASRLEEIIIWLITVEIVMELVKDLVPIVTEWVKAKASVAAAAGTTTMLQSAGLQTAVVGAVTFSAVVVAGAMFSVLYWWWSSFGPARWIKKAFRSWGPKRDMNDLDNGLGSPIAKLAEGRSQS